MAACLARIGAAAEPALPALLPLLADRDDRVRDAAADALEQIGPNAIPALIVLVQTRDVQRLKAWIGSMAGFFLRPARGDTDILVMDPGKVLGNLSWAAYDILQERASLEAAQKAAIRVLGKLGPAASPAVPAVIGASADPNPGLRLEAIQTLGRIGPPARSAIPGLIPMLADTNEAIQAAAAEALGSIDLQWPSDPAAAGPISVLSGKLCVPGRPGEIAVKMFAAIGGTAVPVLIDALKSGDRIAQENAAKALGQIGAGAKAAVPALMLAVQNSHPWVKAEAAKALEKIDEHCK
jgi:HEAT repeat protein